MKIALITDTHFGVRGNNLHFLRYMTDVLDKFFFPLCDREKVDHIIHLGDVFDKRKQIDFQVLAAFNRHFIKPIMDRDLPTDIITGNHDVYFRNTSEINSLKEIFGAGDMIRFHWQPAYTDLEDCRVLLLPWLTESDDQTFIHSNGARYAFGHLDIIGFDLPGNHTSSHGFERADFAHFQHVFSGHYHKRQSNGNITYLGTPYQLTWDDVGFEHGVHILDTVEESLTFHKCDMPMFFRVVFNGKASDADNVTGIDGRYVKVVMRGMHTKKSKAFDQFLDKLSRQNPANIQIEHNHITLPDIETSNATPIITDTFKIIRKNVESLDTPYGERLIGVLHDLYANASSILE